MSTTATCPTCHQPWAIVPGVGKAHPGRRSEAQVVPTPDVDIYGNRVGVVARPSSHWISDGPSAQLITVDDGAETVRAWTCLCGDALEVRESAVELVSCEPGGRPCSAQAVHLNPPSDLYVNPRYGGACKCCGHQGAHWVRKDRQGPLPACLSGAS